MGSQYEVLEIHSSPSGKTSLRVEDDDGAPTLWDAGLFRLLSPALPVPWALGIRRGSVTLAPPAWLVLGYWEDYFDYRPEALQIYERERARSAVGRDAASPPLQVECVAVVDSETGDVVPGADGVTVGRRYDVLEASASPEQGALLRIEDDGGAPTTWRPAMFEVVSSSLPRTWQAHIGPDGSVRFAPPLWLEPDFWERRAEGAPDAIAVYERERARMRKDVL